MEAGGNIRSNMNVELRASETGKMGPLGDKDAMKSMRKAEIAYHKQLGIYKPTLGERLRAFLRGEKI